MQHGERERSLQVEVARLRKALEDTENARVLLLGDERREKRRADAAESALAAARREIAAKDAAIAWACGDKPLPDGRWFDPALFGHGNTIPRYWWRGPLRLYSALAAPASASGEEGTR